MPSLICRPEQASAVPAALRQRNVAMPELRKLVPAYGPLAYGTLYPIKSTGPSKPPGVSRSSLICRPEQACAVPAALRQRNVAMPELRKLVPAYGPKPCLALAQGTFTRPIKRE